MRIVYHHRTRATDAQRVHIREIVHAFRKVGHEVKIVSLVDTESEQLQPENEAAESLWKRWALRVPYAYEVIQIGYNLVGTPLLLWHCLGWRADMIYERYSLFSFAGVLAAKLSRRPIVLEVNSPFALEQFQHREIRAIRLARFLERCICNSATKVIVVSGPLRRILVGDGIREDKIALVPNGVNPEHLGEAAGLEELRRSLRLEGKTVIGFVGWFRPWHGLEFLIDTFVQSDLIKKNVALFLIGDGPAMPELKRKVADYGVTDSVIFAGPVAHERIPPYLQLIDIAVQPAANEYCCPMKILEYMGLGKAVVAPRQENIEELLSDGQDAVLFQPGEAGDLRRALSMLVDDSRARSDIGSRAKETIAIRGLLWTENARRALRFAMQGIRRPVRAEMTKQEKGSF